MRSRLAGSLILIGWLVLFGPPLLMPWVAAAKVFFYALTVDGELVRYDPDADALEIRPTGAQGHITRRSDDSPSPQRIHILDVARQRFMTISSRVGSPVVIDLQAKTATEVRLGPPGTVAEIRQFIYPRRASRFYVHWLHQIDLRRAREVLTAVRLDGRILWTRASLLDEPDAPLYHPDGRKFFVWQSPYLVKLVDGETLRLLSTYNLGPLWRPGFSGPGLPDIRDGRALLAETEAFSTAPLRPTTVFTTDLTFSPASASPRIPTGLPAGALRLVPDGRTVLLHELWRSGFPYGAGRLHFYDITSATKVGTVDFPAPDGADILGFHPDGRRLLLRVFDQDPDTREGVTRLVIVDVVARTVLRDRPFKDITVAVDFVDEP